MISEKLGTVYSALEEKYYAVLDFLDAKGLPVYTYNDFLEGRGLPAFPVTVALLVLIIAGIYGLLLVGTGVNPVIALTFEDQFKESVSGVSVSVKDSSGKLLLAPRNVSNGGTVELQGIPLGTELVLVAEKNGFDKAEKSIVVKREEITASIAMQKQVSAIDAEIQLVDRDTRDLVRGASVSLEWQGQTKNAVTDSAGKAKFAGIPGGGTSVYLSVQADGYETLSGNYSFTGGELKEIGLVAGSAGFSGMSSLVVSVFDEAGQPVRGAKVIVRDRETDTSLEERTLEESEAVFSIANGKSIRVVVEKEGFLSYDSMEEGESRTMRQDEELWPVVLEKGGSRLAVAVFSGQNPLGDATVQLFDVNGNFVDEDVTGFGGSVEFNGLGPKEYFATVYKQGFLPARQLVNVAGTETVSLYLDSADNSNSAYLGISVLDSYRAMANNAGLSFRERVEGELLPLGIPSLKTDISGYASIVARTGTLVVVEAKKEGEEGLGEKLVEANRENQVVIELARPVGIVELVVLDAAGNKGAGRVLIESVSGLLLFDGNLLEGSVFFDAEGYSEAMVAIETDGGKTFSQKVNLEGKEIVEINLGGESSGLAPTITFIGVFGSDNQPAQGLAKGKEYWLAFQSTWPSGAEKGGVHVRLGQDGIAFVDSEEAGITGFEAITSSYFYGKSFQPLPAPGNETADKQNAGMPGQLNKFVELYFDSPENTIAFRVKARANNSISKETVELHYRAWVESGGSVYRGPNDSELGEKMFTETKTGLYAQALDAELKVFEAEASCAQELCAGYFFVMPTGLYVEKQDFSAVTGETYALEIDLSSSKPVSITLKLDTDKAAPKIQFTGYDVDNFVDQKEQDPLPPETSLSGQGYIESSAETAEAGGNPLGFKTGSAGTSITINALGVSPERPRKVRAYFTGVAEGKAEIKMQAVAQSVLGESFVFSVERNKALLVSVAPANPGIGQAFTVKVLDGETGGAIQDATVQVLNTKGEIVDSLVGRGSTRRGLRGEYYFKNSLDPGIYSIIVGASGYKSEQLEITIARDGLLAVNSPVKIDVSKESREKTVALAMRNNAGEDVRELAYEIEKGNDFPEEFSVSVSMPAVVGRGQDTTANIRVIVNLDGDSDESLYGEADLVLKGMVAGNYPTRTVARLQVSYNKQLDPDCLYFDSQGLLVRLIGRAGSSATEEFEVENRCETALGLRASVEALQEDPNLTVGVSPLSIEKGAIGKVKVTVSNSIERNYDLQSRRSYRIKLESSQIAKTIPLSVELWNPRTNLSYPPNITLWMIRSATEELAFAQSPLQVLNNGAVPITAFRAAVTPEAYMQGITVGIKPDNMLYDTAIYPGQPLSPERYVYAESKRTEAMKQAGQGWITFTGVVEGRQYPDLGRATLGVNYSGTKCLKASAVDSLVFSSTEAGQGTLERRIKIRNECGEPIRLSEKVVPETVGGNAFALNAPSVLAPGQEIEGRLILMKKQEASTSSAIKVAGILTSHNESIESNELAVTLKLGALVATTEGKHTAELSMKKCDFDERKNFAFPVLSSDCSSGYCDAEQLAKFLADKADTLVKTAKDKASRANYSTEKFSNCAQANKESCSFEDMGIITEQFPVFLQLDFMTEDVLLKALGESRELKGYDVVQGSKSVDDIGSVGFAFGNVNLGGTFKGCGKYYVQLAGAARVSNREIIAGKDGGRDFVVVVNITQPRVTTEECQNRIENMSNFLPVDKGFVILANYNAWPGFVQASEEFDSLGKKFAEELFGKAEGRYGAAISSASNRLEIVKGDEGNGLLKIRIPKTGQADEPKTMYAHVPSSYNREMEGDIAKALKTFQQRAFSDKDCWGEDDFGQYIVMKGYKDIDKLYGKLAIEGDKAIRINTQEQCVDMNISSKAAEPVTFSTDFLTLGKSKDGIEYVAIKDAKGTILYRENANGEKKAGPELRLAQEKEGSGVYNAAFRFCVKGTSMFPLALENISGISITGKGSATPDRKTEPYKVALQACGIHPKELIEKIAEREKAMPNGTEETYYAMPGWAGKPEPPDSLDLSKFRRMYSFQKELEGKIGATGEPITGMSSYDKAMQPYRYGSIGVYFAACAIPAFFTPWGSVTFDCALPAIWAALDIYPNIETAKGKVIEMAKNVLGPIGKVTIAPIVNGISKLFGGEGKWDPTADKEYAAYTDDQAEAEFGTMLGSVKEFSSAGYTVGTKAILDGLSGAGTKVTLDSARNLMASSLWDEFADGFLKMKKLDGLPKKSANAIKKELADNAKDAAAELLFTDPGMPGVRPSQWHLTKLKPDFSGKPLSDVASQAIEAAYTKSQTKFDEIIGDVLGSATPPAGLKALADTKTTSIFDTAKVSDDLMAKFQGETLGALGSGADIDKQKWFANYIMQSMERNNKEVMEKLAEELTKPGIKGREVINERILSSVQHKWPADIPGRPDPMEIFKEAAVLGKDLPRSTDLSGALINLSAEKKAAFLADLKLTVDNVIGPTVADFSSANSDDIYKAMQKTVNVQVLEKLKGDYKDDLAKIVKGETSKPGALTRLGRFFRGLSLGALSGITSNAIGMLAHRLYWEGVGHSPVESDSSFRTSELVNITDEQGNVIGQGEVLKDIKIVKHQPYKIVIRKTKSGKAETKMIALTTDGQIREMADAIKKNPASSWNADCTGYAKKGPGLLVGTLKPTAITGKVTQDEALAYTENEQAIAYYANYYGNPEELLMAVLLEQPEKIKECGIAEKWWAKNLEEDERTRIVGCAASRLNDALKKGKKLDSFTNAENKGIYVQKIKAVQVEWAKFSVPEAAGTP